MKLKKRLVMILSGVVALSFISWVSQSNNEEIDKTNENEQSQTTDTSIRIWKYISCLLLSNRKHGRCC